MRHQFHHWRGSPFEIGAQHGRALREEIRAEYEVPLRGLAAQRGESESQVLERIVQSLEPIFAHFVPRAIEEIHGLAEGAELSFERAFFVATRDGRAFPLPGEGACRAFVCGSNTTADNEVLIGQTKDTRAPLSSYHIMRYDYNDGRRVLILNFPGWSANMCLTSDVLSVTGNSLFVEPPTGETIPYSLLKRLVMEKKTVQEVLDCLEGLKFRNACFMLADAGGHAVCIESAARRLNVRDVSGHAFGHANSVLAAEFKELELVPCPAPSSPLRQRNIQRLLNEKSGTITVASLQEMTRDHTDFPNSICRHPRFRRSSFDDRRVHRRPHPPRDAHRHRQSLHRTV